MGIGLTGRTLGQLGIGNIGAEVFRLAAPLGMRFIAHDPYADPAHARELGVELVDLETLFRESDFLSVSVPLSEATRGLVDARLIGLMKPTAYLINTARGPIVDQRRWTRRLRASRIAGAGLDVFEVEPAPADEPLLALDNVILTPACAVLDGRVFRRERRGRRARGARPEARRRRRPASSTARSSPMQAWRRRCSRRQRPRDGSRRARRRSLGGSASNRTDAAERGRGTARGRKAHEDHKAFAAANVRRRGGCSASTGPASAQSAAEPRGPGSEEICRIDHQRSSGRPASRRSTR